MEASKSTTRERTTGNNANQDADPVVLMSSKPLHRFVNKEPRSLGIAILILGCAEFLMGFHMNVEEHLTSNRFYIPFWQGLLFIICGSLSIYTELCPSKKMVTLCLSMYVVSLLGIVVSVIMRITSMEDPSYHYYSIHTNDLERRYRVNLMFSIECILTVFSLCVSVLLMFLSHFARFALRSTRTQVIVQHIVAPQIVPTSE